VQRAEGEDLGHRAEGTTAAVAPRRFTIDELAERLALPRTTIYYWVRDLPIPGSGPGGGWPASAQRKGTRAMQRKYRVLREAAYREGEREFDVFAVEPTFRDFVCLYVAEGYKRNRNVAAICNADPVVMEMCERWMTRLTTKRLDYAIQYHADQELRELRRFWGACLEIDPTRIRLQRKSNSNELTGRTWRSQHGVLAISAYDTLFRARLEAWMDRLRSEWR
jgi:hypothetical protein